MLIHPMAERLRGLGHHVERHRRVLAAEKHSGMDADLGRPRGIDINRVSRSAPGRHRIALRVNAKDTLARTGSCVLGAARQRWLDEVRRGLAGDGKKSARAAKRSEIRVVARAREQTVVRAPFLEGDQVIDGGHQFTAGHQRQGIGIRDVHGGNPAHSSAPFHRELRESPRSSIAGHGRPWQPETAMGRGSLERLRTLPAPEFDWNVGLRGQAACGSAHVRADPPILVGVLQRSYIESYDGGRQWAPKIA